MQSLTDFERDRSPRPCAPWRLANALTHLPMPCCPGASCRLHVTTCRFTRWPQTNGFGLPVTAAFAPTPPPAVRTTVVAVMTSFDFATAATERIM